MTIYAYESMVKVKILALLLFASQDLEQEAWDFLYTAKYT